MPNASAFDKSYLNLGANIQPDSFTDAITAKAGGGQAGATLLINACNRISVCATAGDSTLLPPAAGGWIIQVSNGGAASCNVFPAVGEQVNALGTNTAFALAAGKSALFFSTAALQWSSILSA